MKEPIRSAEEHARDWCLVMTAAPGVHQARVDAPGLGKVILTRDGEGSWWAVADRCQRCNGVLGAVAMGEAGTGVITCAACGAEHGPHVAGCTCIGTLVVDDEVYLLRKP